jgi:streptomycin 6-kinase
VIVSILPQGALLFELSSEFIQRVRDTFGPDGQVWLSQFSETLQTYRERWSLTLRPPIEPLSYNYVAPALLPDGEEVVLKLGVPNPELLTEIEALRRYDGRGAVRLLRADPDGGALLLERVRPGIALIDRDFDDQRATRIAALVMQRLWRPVQGEQPFPTVETWFRGLSRLRACYDGGTGPLPPALVARAEALLAELSASADAPVLLHGDLHHWNILAAEREPWLAIDPKGIIGEPAFEVGAWMYNPITDVASWPKLRHVSARRLDQFSQILSLDRRRLLGWSLAQAVLSACWSLEENQDGWQNAIAVAQALAEID